MDKLVIVINGKGASGKDTLCDIAGKAFSCKNISSITPIKKMAELGGWNGEKNEKSRKMLSDLKQLFIEYNDLPLSYMLDEYNEFMRSDNQILLVHIREPQEIEKLKSRLHNCVTLLIKGRNEDKVFGNDSDDLVERYNYDYTYNNTQPIEKVEGDFIPFITKVFQDNCK